MIYLLAVFVLVLSCSVSGDKVDENLKEAMKIGNLVGTLNTMFNKSTDDAQLASAGIFKLKHIIKAQKTPLHATPTPKRDSQYPTMKASEEAKPLEKEKKSSYDEESTQDQGPEAEGRMLDWNTDDDSLVDDNSEVETSEPKSRDASVGPTNAPSEQVSGPTMPPDEEPDKKHDSSIHASPTKASTTMADPTEIAPTKRADKAAESTITSPAVSPTEPPAAPTTVLKKPIQLAEPEQKKPHPTMPREDLPVAAPVSPVDSNTATPDKATEDLAAAAPVSTADSTTATPEVTEDLPVTASVNPADINTATPESTEDIPVAAPASPAHNTTDTPKATEDIPVAAPASPADSNTATPDTTGDLPVAAPVSPADSITATPEATEVQEVNTVMPEAALPKPAKPDADLQTGQEVTAVIPEAALPNPPKTDAELQSSPASTVMPENSLPQQVTHKVHLSPESTVMPEDSLPKPAQPEVQSSHESIVMPQYSLPKPAQPEVQSSHESIVMPQYSLPKQVTPEVIPSSSANEKMPENALPENALQTDAVKSYSSATERQSAVMSQDLLPKPAIRSVSPSSFTNEKMPEKALPKTTHADAVKVFSPAPATAVAAAKRTSEGHMNADATIRKKTQPAAEVLGKVCKARVDIAFVLDGSKSVGPQHFRESLNFVNNIINNFDVSHGNTHVALAVCADTPHIVFDFRAFNDHESILRAMTSVTYPKGKLFAGGCLNAIKSGIFINSGRHEVPKILYFMAGGASRDHVALPSRSLRDMGVQLFSLGLGNEYNARELKEVATSPYNDHVMATRYGILGLLRPLVTAQLCRGSGGKLVKGKYSVTVERPLFAPASNHDTPRVIHHPIDEKHGKIVPKIFPKKKTDKAKDAVERLLSINRDQTPVKVPEVMQLPRYNTKMEQIRKRAALKADIRRKLHMLLAKLNGRFPNEDAVYRSIVYNVNGHKGDVTCKDKHALCPKWKKDGLCDLPPKLGGMDTSSVQTICPKSCGICWP